MYDSKLENNIKKHSTFQDFFVINRGNKSFCSQSKWNEQALNYVLFLKPIQLPLM